MIDMVPMVRPFVSYSLAISVSVLAMNAQGQLSKRCAQEEQEEAPVSDLWLAKLPTVVTVRSAIKGTNPKDTEMRRDATFHILGEFYRNYVRLTNCSFGRAVGTHVSVPSAKDRWSEYGAVLQGRPPRESNPLAHAPAFISGTIEKFVSAEAAAAFERTEIYRNLAAEGSAPGSADPSSAFNPADLPSWIQANLAAARGHADLTVFGFEFGRPINLPKCGNEGAGLLGALATKSGAPSACVGDAVGELRAAWSPMGIMADLSGVKPAHRSDAFAVTLASNKCPVWLQSQSSSCAMQVRLSAGALVSIVVAPGADDGLVQAIPEDLTQKYGPPDKRFHARCISRESGTSTDWSGRVVMVPLPPQTHEAVGLDWSKLPGLHVRYEPFDSEANCRAGVIQVELAGWHKMNVEASARARAAGPKM
jgi:hypothetical protein